MEFRETTPADRDFVGKHSASRGIFHKQPEVFEFCYTLEHEGKILGVGGLRLITPQVAWAHVDMTTFARPRIKTCYRVIGDVITNCARDNGVRRVQAYVDLDFPEGIRMAQHLGFKKESTMANFIDGRPAGLYVRHI